MGSVRRSRVGWLAFVGLALLALAPMGVVLSRPVERSYAFLPDHPVQMWHDGKDRWAYYSVGLGPSSELAKRVRPTLLSSGFREDSSGLFPVRFVRGDEEVIVCDGSEFGLGQNSSGTTKMVRMKPMAGMNPSQTVLVKNGPGTGGLLALFKMKKLLRGW